MKLNLKIGLLVLVAMVAACGNAPSQEDLERANANADSLSLLQEDFNRLKYDYDAAMVDGTLDAAALSAMSDQLIATGFKLTDLYTEMSRPPEGEKTNWLEIGLSVVGALTGVRVMRGGASKGLLAAIPGVGKGTA